MGIDHPRDRDPAARELLDDHRVGRQVEPHPAVLLGDRDPEQPELLHLLDDRLGELVLVVVVLGLREDLLVDELADHLRDGLLLVGLLGELRGGQCHGCQYLACASGDAEDTGGAGYGPRVAAEAAAGARRPRRRRRRAAGRRPRTGAHLGRGRGRRRGARRRAGAAARGRRGGRGGRCGPLGHALLGHLGPRPGPCRGRASCSRSSRARGSRPARARWPWSARRAGRRGRVPAGAARAPGGAPRARARRCGAARACWPRSRPRRRGGRRAVIGAADGAGASARRPRRPGAGPPGRAAAPRARRASRPLQADGAAAAVEPQPGAGRPGPPRSTTASANSAPAVTSIASSAPGSSVRPERCAGGVDILSDCIDAQRVDPEASRIPRVGPITAPA